MPKFHKKIPEHQRHLYFDEHGKLKKGHPGLPGRGRPRKQTELEYLYALQDGLPPEDLSKLWDKALESAMEHSRKYKTPKMLFKAIEMMMSWGYGKPKQSIEYTDANAIEIMKQLIADGPGNSDILTRPEEDDELSDNSREPGDESEAEGRDFGGSY